MDLFNKRKVKELEERIKYLSNEIDGYMKNERHWSRQIESLEKISNNTMEENQKLIKWIMNILKEFGTVEIGDRQHIEIPIHRTSIKAHYDNIKDMYISTRERIEIPSITIVKMS